MVRLPVIFVHATDGRPVTYHVGLGGDRLDDADDGTVELVRDDGEKIKLRESRKEIRKLVQEAKDLERE